MNIIPFPNPPVDAGVVAGLAPNVPRIQTVIYKMSLK